MDRAYGKGVVNPFTGVTAYIPIYSLAASSGSSRKGCGLEEVDPLVVDVVGKAWFGVGDGGREGEDEFPTL
jgi:hypothetical protein